jgi:hypothetical protein
MPTTGPAVASSIAFDSDTNKRWHSKYMKSVKLPETPLKGNGSEKPRKRGKRPVGMKKKK